jgi:2-polyprenyl-6-methoxyphenol hydroxylase-like FAD-dependent oxidoreductase
MNGRTVLISGAGIGGPALGFWLKAAGYEPTLIEHASTLLSGGYVSDLWAFGYDIAERMGLAAEINRVGYHMREMRIVDDQGKRVAGLGMKSSSAMRSRALRRRRIACVSNSCIRASDVSIWWSGPTAYIQAYAD